MPVFRSGAGLAPEWCELEYFEIIDLPAGTAHRFDRLGAKEKLVVADGRVRVASDGRAADTDAGACIDLQTANGRFEVEAVYADAKLVRMCGRWGDEVGGCGLFAAEPAEETQTGGDPVPYSRNTAVDNHYHDCDEYWIILQGHGLAVSEGRTYEVGPGDCVATGMGHHHDLPRLLEPLRLLYFETTLEGRKRSGHLWNHTHGQAEPKPERV